MTLKDTLQDIFEDHFGDDPAYQFDVTASNAGDITGELTLERFDGLEDFERQNLIWDVLDEHQRAAIVLIVANSPDETAAMRAQCSRDRGVT